MLLLLATALLLAACGTDCPDGQTDVGGRCVPEVDVSVTAGETATGGEGMTGGSTGGTTTGGTGGGTGGNTGGSMTGGSEMMPCDGACGGDTPLCLAANDSDAGMDICVACIDETQCEGDDLCDPGLHTCVQCVTDNDCSGPEDLCLEGACVACKSDSDCTDPKAARCDPADYTCKGCNDTTQCKGVEDGSGTALPVCLKSAAECVQCDSSTQCTDPAAPACNTTSNTCVGCGLVSTQSPDDDCSGISKDGIELAVCDTSDRTCVQCTGTKYTACGTDPTADDVPFVCDSTTRTCSTTATERSGKPCSPCVSDAQCGEQQLCVLQTFGDPVADVGFFCFWKGNATGEDTPEGNCSANGQPYSVTESNATSIDGVQEAVCALRNSTCPAHNDAFVNKSCGDAEDIPDDQSCGFSHPSGSTSPLNVDSFCINANTAQSPDFVCVPKCGSSKDCAATCIGTPPNAYCSL